MVEVMTDEPYGSIRVMRIEQKREFWYMHKDGYLVIR